jgi:hypothetical protein
MAPVLPPGMDVSLVSATARRPRWGDVVLVRFPQGLRLHRLVWPVTAGLGGLRTKGDRACALDPPLPPGAVLASVADPREPAILRLSRAFLSLAQGLTHWLRDRLGRRP